MESIQAPTHGLDPSLVTLFEGFYKESVLCFDEKQLQDKDPCLVAHVDCDRYSSSRDVFTFLDEVATTSTWRLLDA